MRRSRRRFVVGNVFTGEYPPNHGTNVGGD